MCIFSEWVCRCVWTKDSLLLCDFMENSKQKKKQNNKGEITTQYAPTITITKFKKN